jgi:hypothetical protein
MKRNFGASFVFITFFFIRENSWIHSVIDYESTRIKGTMRRRTGLVFLRVGA